MGDKATRPRNCRSNSYANSPGNAAVCSNNNSKSFKLSVLLLLVLLLLSSFKYVAGLGSKGVDGAGASHINAKRDCSRIESLEFIANFHKFGVNTVRNASVPLEIDSFKMTLECFMVTKCTA